MSASSEHEAQRCIAAAREDLALARHAAGGGFHAGACFHAQQAAEKAVKAIHYGRGARAVIGHSVRKLIDALTPPALTGLLDPARELDLLYIPSRYPNGLGSGTPSESFGPAQSERALGHADAIVQECERTLAPASGG